MAKITLTDANLHWTKFDLQYRRDTAIVRAGALRNKFYSTGAGKLILNGTLTSGTVEEKGYLEGVVLGAFDMGDTIEFTPPSNIFGFTGTATEGMRTSASVAAGSNAIGVEDTSGGTFSGTIPTGTRITFNGHEGSYIVNDFDSATQELTIFPFLREDVTAETNITYDDIKLHFEFVDVNTKTVYDKYADSYVQLELRLEEVL